MQLLVDIGNSRIKWALKTAQGLRHQGNLALTDPDLPRHLREDWQTLPPPAAIHLCNVAGAVPRNLVETLASELWHRNCHEVHTRPFACGLRNGYRDPRQLGVDRWLALIAAWQRQHRACCVVDCGTAVTCDLIDDRGRHLGGLIAPGETLMLEALTRGTHALEARPGQALWLADNTTDGIVAGCRRALAGFAGHCLEQARQQLGQDPLPLLTGGSAPRLLPLLGSAWIHAPDLVLSGLALYVQEALE